ncbi:MAG: A24 family peptidase C-terminal domain-containing protein [Candidatus Methanomethylicia archaeon]
MHLEDIIAIIRSITLILTYAFASYYDIKTREVPDKLWIFPVAIGTPLLVYDVLYSNSLYSIVLIIFSSTLSISLAIILFYCGFFGGADAKALISAGILMPRHPFSFQTLPIIGISLLQFLSMPLTILTNAAILTLTLPIVFLFRNILWKFKRKKLFEDIQSSTFKKTLVLFIGYKIEILEFIRKLDFYHPLEQPRRINGKREIKLFQRLVSDEEFLKFKNEILTNYKNKMYDKYIWVTPLLPFMIYLTIGAVISIIIGDLATIIALTIISSITGSII